MPRTSIIPPNLNPEQLQELSQTDWRFIEAKGRKVLKGLLRSSTSKAINSTELVNIMRSAALAKEQAYPDSSKSGLSVNLPAKLLKPIEQAILCASKKHHRESLSSKPKVVETSSEVERT